MMARNQSLTLMLLSALVPVVFFATSVTGRVEIRIAGGGNAEDGDIPFIGSLRSHVCGGSLIKADVVLTAAHCFDDGLLDGAVFGDTELFGSSPNRAPVKVSSTTLHPSYNKDTIVNDIAIIRLSRSLTGSEGVSTIPTATSHNTEDYESCRIAGWGFYDAAEKPAENLQVAETNIVEAELCKKDEEPSDKIKFIEGMMICAQHDDSDACGGDSGGPLYCIHKETGQKELVGIVSYGPGECEKGGAGVYTNVSYFSEWIENEIPASSHDLSAAISIASMKNCVLIIAAVIAAMFFE